MTDLQARARAIAADRVRGASQLLADLMLLLDDAVTAGREATVDVAHIVCAGQPAMASLWNICAAAVAEFSEPGRYQRRRAEFKRASRALVRSAGAALRDALQDIAQPRLLTVSYSSSVFQVLLSLTQTAAPTAGSEVAGSGVGGRPVSGSEVGGGVGGREIPGSEVGGGVGGREIPGSEVAAGGVGGRSGRGRRSPGGAAGAAITAGDLEVICAESLPGGEGAVLARDLGAAGINARVVVDMTLTKYLSSASAVVVGADAVTSRDWTNKVGTFGLCAAAWFTGVPVYVVASRDKAAPTSLAQRLEVPDSFEKTPAQLATLFLTDTGPVAPEALPSFAERFSSDHLIGGLI